ncbi:MAG: tRNA modification GTPase [Parasphingorhabdus sp.]|jgi:tRNA modification GTPase
MTTDTIAAIATPPGIGGVGIIRVSGKDIANICQKIAGNLPKPRLATFRNFKAPDQTIIDQGIILYFPAPNSFTGENILELQGHGGRVVMQLLLDAVLEAGARLARPGEFSERAFLNEKLDLIQAEAIADLIESGSQSAARLAVKALQGEFSNAIQNSVNQVENLRLFVEAAIDFPDEEIDFLADKDLHNRCHNAVTNLQLLLQRSERGHLLRNNLNVVLTGAPNVGKSSLLNALSGKSRAIVSDIPGTTRDTIDEHIDIGGVQLRLVDTAGIRSNADSLEQEGIRRAHQEIDAADLVLVVLDDSNLQVNPEEEFTDLEHATVLYIHNKIDVSNDKAYTLPQKASHLWVSAKTGLGINLLEDYLSKFALQEAGEENVHLARSRHLIAMQIALKHLKSALQQLKYGYGELVAEDLKLCHRSLGEITGQTTSDELLGKIFGSFCIGK